MNKVKESEMKHYLLDPDFNPVEVPRREEYYAGIEESMERTHIRTTFQNVVVDTSFIPNHQFGDGPPIVFETMYTVDGEWSDYQQRYSTYVQAKMGHIEVIRNLLLLGSVPDEH